MSKAPMRGFRAKHMKRSIIAMHVMMMPFVPALADDAGSTAKNSELGTVTITGEADKVGNGQMVREDAAKARSNVTRAELSKERPSSNPYQSMSLLPGVNTFSYDGTGLFGGGLTIRGFNSDQIGFTVNGAPVNDSGSFAVYPQEFVDLENLCQEFVTQGSTDTDAPHVGATGGNVGLVTCDPENARRYRFSQTIGTDALLKTFLRADSGRFAGDRAKMFVSASHAEANKWKGEGGAKRDHVDFGVRYDIDAGNHISSSVMYNRAQNNNVYSLSLKELDQNGYYYDYSGGFVGHKAGVNGTAQTDASQSPAYYKLATNPFENVIWTVDGVFKLSDAAQLKVSPYYWYGYGTGGTQQTVLSESTLKTDLNGDGDRLDKVIYASSSVTETNRPGINTSLTYTLANHTITTGLWFERAEHKQTGPAVAVDPNGNSSSLWLSDGWLVKADGSTYESRNWDTISTAWQAFLQDSVSLADDRFNITGGVRTPHVKRDFTNYANDGTYATSGTTYHYTAKYDDVLPQFGMRYNFTQKQQVFFNIAKNFKAPPNYAYSPSNNNIAIINGNAELIGNVKAETSVNTDLGYRFQGDFLTLSGSLFLVNFKNRMTTAYDPTVGKSVYTNAGSVRNRGVELEAGTAPVHGWSVYSSLTYNDSETKNDLSTATGTLQTSGKTYVLTPKWMSGLSVQYASGPFYVRTRAKYTGTQYATLMNDEKVPVYWLFDLDAGYQFQDVGYMKKPTLRFNVSNLFDKQYRNPSGSQNNAQPYGSITSSGTVYYYLGAPRSYSVTFSADF